MLAAGIYSAWGLARAYRSQKSRLSRAPRDSDKVFRHVSREALTVLARIVVKGFPQEPLRRFRFDAIEGYA